MQELRELFRGIGYDLGDDEFRRIYWRAATAHAPELGQEGEVGVEQFRRALNEYEDAREARRGAPQWWEEAGRQ